MSHWILFQDKVWRTDTPEAQGMRSKFCAKMRQYTNRVWKPQSDAVDNKSEVTKVIFHTLDSFVWEFVTGEYQSDDTPVNVADLYLCFCRCPILASKRAHSTSGAAAASRRQKQGMPVQWRSSGGEQWNGSAWRSSGGSGGGGGTWSGGAWSGATWSDSAWHPGSGGGGAV